MVVYPCVKASFFHTESFTYSLLPFHFAEGERPHPEAHECVYDLQQAASCAGSSETPKPGQPHCQQDTWRVVVCFGTQRETEIPRPRISGYWNCPVLADMQV